MAEESYRVKRPAVLFLEGHIGLESPKTTKRDAEGLEAVMTMQGFAPSPAD